MDTTLGINRRGSFRSHSLSILLSLISNVVFYPIKATRSILEQLAGELSVSQRILISCENTMTWIWSTWNDHRVVQFDATTMTVGSG